MIASHFDEEWESCCNGMCDHCNDQRGKVETLPLSSHFSTIQKILERALLQDTRLTGYSAIFNRIIPINIHN